MLDDFENDPSSNFWTDVRRALLVLHLLQDRLLFLRIVDLPGVDANGFQREQVQDAVDAEIEAAYGGHKRCDGSCR